VSKPDDGQVMRSDPPLPGGTCELSQLCVQGLNSPRACHATTRNGGADCYRGLKIWQQDLTATYGCPLLTDPNQPVLASRAFCWCGLGENRSEQVLDVRGKNHSELAQYAAERQGNSPASTSISHSVEPTQGSSLRGASGVSALRSRQTHKLSDEEKVANVEGGNCVGPVDVATQQHFGKTGMSIMMKQCGEVMADSKNPPPPGSLQELMSNAFCMAEEALQAGGSGLTTPCAQCYGWSIQCSEVHCLAQCACVSWQDPTCNNCMTQYCKPIFDQCSGLS